MSRSIFVNDVVFVVGKEKKRIFAQKQILSRIHPNFDSIFRKVFGAIEEIYFPDFDPDGFQAMLNSFWNLKSGFTSVEVAWSALQCAQHFKLEGLIYHCEGYICDNTEITLSNAPVVFEKAMQWNHNGLKIKIKHVLEVEMKNLISSDEFLKYPQKLVKILAACQTLHLRSEYDLYTAIVKWGYSECEKKKLKRNKKNVRKFLEEIIPYIRFLLMTTEELVSVLEGRLMTYDEISPFLCRKIKPTTNLARCASLSQSAIRRNPFEQDNKYILGLVPMITSQSNDPIHHLENFFSNVEKQESFTFSFEMHSGEIFLFMFKMNVPHFPFVRVESLKAIKMSADDVEGKTVDIGFIFSGSQVHSEPDLPIHLKSFEKVDVTIKTSYLNVPSPKFTLEDSIVVRREGLKFVIKNQSKEKPWPFCELVFGFQH